MCLSCNSSFNNYGHLFVQSNNATSVILESGNSLGQLIAIGNKARGGIFISINYDPAQFTISTVLFVDNTVELCG